MGITHRDTYREELLLNNSDSGRYAHPVVNHDACNKSAYASQARQAAYGKWRLRSIEAGDPTSPRIRELRSLRSTGALRKCLKESLLNSGNISDRKDAIIRPNV